MSLTPLEYQRETVSDGRYQRPGARATPQDMVIRFLEVQEMRNLQRTYPRPSSTLTPDDLLMRTDLREAIIQEAVLQNEAVGRQQALDRTRCQFIGQGGHLAYSRETIFGQVVVCDGCQALRVLHNAEVLLANPPSYRVPMLVTLTQRSTSHSWGQNLL
jgi:hypothetical protein